MESADNGQSSPPLFPEQFKSSVSAGEQGARQSNRGDERRKPRFKPINRDQMLMRSMDIEALVEADHPVRAIWEMLGRVDLSAFEQNIRAVEGGPGQATLSPRLLASLWVYGYSEGVSAARELSRMCEDDRACQWLTAMQGVNYHTLSDFRVEQKDALDQLFVQVLGVLSAEGLVELKQVAQDGTKIRANAGKDTFRREERLREHLQLAEQQIEAMGDPRSDAISQRVARARQRGLAEKKQRLELALEELKKIQQSKSADKRADARASMTDPEARVMKDSNGGYVPAYNVQICTDAAHAIIVDVKPVQAANDWDQLAPAVDRIQQKLGVPGQMIADAGYISHDNIETMAEQHVDLIGPMPAPSADCSHRLCNGIHRNAFTYNESADHYVCPAGKILKLTTMERHAGRIQWRYRARPSDCRVCVFRDQCCPKGKSRRITRHEDSDAVKAFLTKMQTEEAKQIYRRRPQVAEFVNAWIKEKLGLRQFRLRGLAKVTIECVWVGLTYNIQQWARFCWRKPQPAAA